MKTQSAQVVGEDQSGLLIWLFFKFLESWDNIVLRLFNYCWTSLGISSLCVQVARKDQGGLLIGFFFNL